MPIDPRIPLMSQPVQLPNMLDLYGKAEELKASRQRNKLADLAFAEKERAVANARTEADLIRDSMNPDGSMNRQKFFSDAAQKGLGSRIPEWQKGFAEQDEAQFKAQKAQRDAQKGQIDAALAKAKLYGQVTGAAKDQPSWDRALQFLKAQGEDISQLNPIYDPAYVEQGRQMALDAVQQYELAQKKLDYDLDVQQFGETKRHNKATEQNSMANAAATRQVASATRDAAGMARDRDTEMKLSDDYRTQSKAFKEVSDAYRQISGTLDKATESPAATLAAATKFMKLLDPGSVVRESELGMALAASGVLDRAGNYFEVLKRGKVLTKQQAADFKAITAQIYQAAQQQQQMIDSDYTGRAQRYGLRPENIVQDLGQNGGKSGGNPAGGKQDIHAQAEAILRGE